MPLNLRLRFDLVGVCATGIAPLCQLIVTLSFKEKYLQPSIRSVQRQERRRCIVTLPANWILLDSLSCCCPTPQRQAEHCCTVLQPISAMSRLNWGGFRPVTVDIRHPTPRRSDPIRDDSHSFSSSYSSELSETESSGQSAFQRYQTINPTPGRLRRHQQAAPAEARRIRMPHDDESHVRSQRHRHRHRSGSRQHSEERSTIAPSPRRRDTRSSSNLRPTLASTRSMSHESRARHSRDREKSPRNRHRRHHSSHDSPYISYAEHERRKARRGYSSDVVVQR